MGKKEGPWRKAKVNGISGKAFLVSLLRKVNEWFLNEGPVPILMYKIGVSQTPGTLMLRNRVGRRLCKKKFTLRGKFKNPLLRRNGFPNLASKGRELIPSQQNSLKLKKRTKWLKEFKS